MCGPSLDPGLRPGAWHLVAERCFPCAYGEPESPTLPPTRPRTGARHGSMTIETARCASLEFVCVFGQDGVRSSKRIETRKQPLLDLFRASSWTLHLNPATTELSSPRVRPQWQCVGSVRCLPFLPASCPDSPCRSPWVHEQGLETLRAPFASSDSLLVSLDIS